MFNIREIDVDTAHRLLEESTPAARFIDVRSAAELAAGIIPGAVHIPLHDLPTRLGQIPNQGKVILYCHTGARSAQACVYLDSVGFDNIHNLRGGIIAWLQNGRAVA